MPRIMVIDDDIRHRHLYAETLRQTGFEVQEADSAESAAKIIQSTPPDMIVSDVRMPGMDGISFLRQVKETRPEMPFLLVTAFADVRDAVKALKLGAVDYLEKPIDLDELAAAVSDTLMVPDKGAPKMEIPPPLLEGIIVESPAMRALFRDALKVASSDATVLLTGESGTGKEVLAKFIHRASPRAVKPFLAINCAALPKNLIASELFGHHRGAFTGATSARPGFFREADKGSLFLDEIGDMPLDLQPTLLRAIETGRILPLGGDREVESDVRLIAATNQKLEEMVGNGLFRQDLYYRLNVISFELPPLRTRPEEVLPLARQFLTLRQAQSKRFSPAASRLLQNYSWPGNVRELAHAVERASLIANTDVILPEHLPAALSRGGNTLAPDASVISISQAEQDAIRRALERTVGNRTRAAEILGISRRALLYKLKRME